MRDIAQLGHPVLRQNAAPVLRLPDPELGPLAEDLLATLVEAGGVGIAAPQVYLSQRIIVIASRPNPRYPQAPEMAPLVMVNPVLLEGSAAIEKGWEGCLSVPSIRGLVPRHTRVAVKYQTIEGAEVHLELGGFPARIFQHELDHLDGLVFLDRVESNRDLVSDREYQAMVP